MRWSRAQDLLFFRFTIPVVTLLLKAVDGAFRGAVVDGETAHQDENQLATCGDSGVTFGQRNHTRRTRLCDAFTSTVRAGLSVQTLLTSTRCVRHYAAARDCGVHIKLRATAHFPPTPYMYLL